jgi:hypothetical protein
VKVLKAMPALTADNVVRGQFRGYRSEKGVAADSKVETFVALRLQIDSWRWQGVPVYIRAGKCLPVTCTEVFIRLRRPPPIYQGVHMDSNYCRLRITPDVTLAIGANVIAPGQETVSQTAEMVGTRLPRADEMEAYERVLGDAMQGEVGRTGGRQPLPTPDRRNYAPATGVARGVYVLADAPGANPEVILEQQTRAAPLGATVCPGGFNFGIFSRGASGVELLLFDREDDARPTRVIRLDPAANRTYHYWHIFVSGVRPGQLYGYRMNGSWDPANGTRFDPTKVLLDPCAAGLRTSPQE